MQIAVIGSLLLTLLFNLFIYQTQPGFGSFFVYLFLNTYFYFTRDKESKHVSLGLTFSAISLIFAALIGLRSNEIVTFLNLLSASFFTSIAFYFYKLKSHFNFEIFEFLITPLKVASHNLNSLINLFVKGQSLPGSNHSSTIQSVVKALIITVPIFIILLSLLTNADPIFNKLTQDLLSNLGERLIISTILLVFLLMMGITKIYEHFKEKKQIEANLSHTVEVSIITGVVAALFAVFILVQIRYLFSNVSIDDLKSLGISSQTYSEYVRKGFFELLIASVISSGIIIYVLRILHFLKGNQKLLAQTLTSILTIEVGLLLLSAAQRVNLYQMAHGLTRARIFGFIFLIWLAAILIILLAKIIRDYKQSYFFGAVITATVFVVNMLSFTNIDGLIATQYKPSVNKEIDYFYISSLSSDSVEGWEEAVNNSISQINELQNKQELTPEDNRKLTWAQSTLGQLDNKVNYLYDKYGGMDQLINKFKSNCNSILSGKNINGSCIPDYILEARNWQSYNLGEQLAFQKILEKKSTFDQIGNYLIKASDIRSRMPEDVIRNTPIDRSTNPPF